MKITIYTTHTCPYCFELMDWLREHGIKYESWYVDDDPKKEQERLELSDGVDIVPFTVVETDDKVYKLIGFPRTKFKRLFKKLGLLE